MLSRSPTIGDDVSTIARGIVELEGRGRKILGPHIDCHELRARELELLSSVEEVGESTLVTCRGVGLALRITTGHTP